jgi:phosphate uptake regulator
METRKIQLIGSSSYMISLPKRWIQSHNLKQGDEVSLYADEGMVVVIPKEYRRLVRIAMKGIPEKNGDLLRRYIYAIYMLGFDEIVLEDIDAASLIDEFTAIVHELIGMEIIDVSPDKIVFRILVTPELDIIAVLKRIVQMINGMFRDLQTVIDGRKELLKNIKAAEENVDRFYWLAVRLENRIIREKSFKWSELRFVLGSRMVAKILEDISDLLTHLSKLIEGTEEASKYISMCSSLFNKAFEAYHESDLISGNEVVVDVEELQKRIVERLEEVDDARLALIFQNLLAVLWNIRSIGEIAINRAVREMAEKA